MQKESNIERQCVRQRSIVTLLLVVPVSLLGLTLLGRWSAVPLAGSGGASKNPPQLLAPATYHELLAVRFEDCDVALMNLLCAEGLPNAEGLDVQSALTLLDSWAVRIRSETQRHFYKFQRNPGEFEHSEGYFKMLIMAVVLYEDLQVRYNPDLIANVGQPANGDGFFADSRDVFLHGLLGPRRMGTCSSMPVLYVALGRRLGYPLKLVTTKGHIFVRWDSPAERFNLDATGKGMNRYNDEYYRNWPFSLSEAEIKEHGYLKSLSAAEELAVFLSIRGQCLMAAGRYAEAASSYEHAVRLRPTSRDQRLLLAQAQAKCSDFAKLQSSVSSALASDFGQSPSPPNMNHGISSKFAPDPNPLRQIR